MGDVPAVVSWLATSASPSKTESVPPGCSTSRTLRPMQRLGTENSRPAARTSMVVGTTCQETLPAIASSDSMLGSGMSASFSLRANRRSGGRCVVSLASSLHLAWMRAIIPSSSSRPSKSPS